jgi:CrcB protein
MRASVLSQLLLVAAGGALGSAARFLMAGAAHGLLPGVLFPVGTLAVNVAGSLVIGLLGGLAEGRQFLVPELRLFLFTGILGGFTTFSAFAFETLGLALDAAWWRLALNVAAQLLCGLGAVTGGYVLGRGL